MDSFTVAVLIGVGIVLMIFLGLIAFDRGTPESPTEGPREPRSS